MSEEKRLLVLVVDVDDDLGEKTKLRGPVIGRKAVLEAATKLALADPEESDANTLFHAIKTFDNLSKDHKVEIAALSGSKNLGYEAHTKVIKQLESVVKHFHPEACIFVSDGASDEQVLPIIQSRIKINSVERVIIRQTQELEKTYFVILNKLKDPGIARVVFGIPGLALALWFWLGGEGLRYFIGLLGLYMILRAIGIEEKFFQALQKTRISFDRISFVFFFASVPLALVALSIAFTKASAVAGPNLVKFSAIFIKEALLLPIALLLVVTGMVVETYYENKKYSLPSQFIMASAIVLFWWLLVSASDWIIGTNSFADFFTTMILIIVVMFLATFLAREFKKDIIGKLHLEGKDVFTELGSQLGKIVGVNRKKDTFIIETSSGQKIDLEFNHIANIGDTVIIRY